MDVPATSNTLREMPLGILLDGDPNSSSPRGSLGRREGSSPVPSGRFYCQLLSRGGKQSSEGDCGSLQDGGGGVVDTVDYRKHQASDHP